MANDVSNNILGDKNCQKITSHMKYKYISGEFYNYFIRIFCRIWEKSEDISFILLFYDKNKILEVS